MHDEAMAKLRAHVAQLEDEELFESVAHLQRGAPPGMEPQPTSNNIHNILASTMNLAPPPPRTSSARKGAAPSRSASTAHVVTPARSVPRHIR